MSDNYIPTTSQTVTIAIGDVKTVSFNNVLKKGTVKITKMSEDGQVAGHTFRLSGTSAAGTSVNMTATTDANGVATFNNVPIGKNYKLEEINTAAKYVVPEVQAGVVVEYNAATEAKFENKLARGNLKITKTSEDGFVSGMTFRLSGTSISGAAVNETATTDENGVILFKDILIGNNYTVQEINTAERYVVPTIQEGVTISLNKTTNLQFENKLARGAVEVKKTSEDGKTAGITFRLYGTAINGETVDMTAVTDANGIATFNNVLIGNNYSVEEVNTAAKYVVPEVKAGVKVTLGNTTDVEVYNKLKRGDLRVTKTSEDGLVEGITEWLPISSTGHMILVDEFVKLQVSDSFLALFLVVIQIGAIMAVIILYFHKLNPFSPSKTVDERRSTWRLWGMVVIGCLPAAVFGFALDDFMNEHFYNKVTVAAMLILYGIVFIVLERRNRRRFKEALAEVEAPRGRHARVSEADAEAAAEASLFKVTNVDDIDWKTALKIGFFQCLAMVPGTSRSGATIIGGMLTGCSRTAATEFTFFLAIPVMLGWGVVKVAKFVLAGVAMTQTEIVVLVVGIVTAFVMSVISIKFLMGYIKKNDFTAFGIYRIIVGALVLGYFSFETMGMLP